MNIKPFKYFNENSENTNYMFFSNLQHICRMASEMIKMDDNKIDEMLTDGHDWANDHISKSMESISHVYNFLTHSDLDSDEESQSHFEEEPNFEEEEEPQFVEPIEEEPQIEESVKSFKDFK